MAEIVTPVVSTVLKKLSSVAIQKLLAVFDVRKDIENLRRSLTNIQVLLNSLENNTTLLNNWSEDLKAAAYDAEDLIESWTTEYHQWEMKKQVQKLHLLFSPFNLVFVLRESSKLREVTERIDQHIRNGASYSTIVGNTINRTEDPPQTGPLENSFIVSREEDKKNIIKLLITDEEDDNFSLVSILGMGGLGKTTLARNVIGDKEVGDRFEIIVWACVTQPFKIESILSEIVMSPKTTDTNVSHFTLAKLQERSRGILAGKRFLLVLDNLWNHETDHLDPLLSVLVLGGKGSRVLVTSRITKVSDIDFRGLKIKGSYNLARLGENESWSLFANFAFKEDSDSDREEFEKYGREIVRKCQGLPLALKQMGATVKGKDLGLWKSIANSQTWREKEIVLPALRLSYNHLHTSYHKQCFAYCSLFPKAHVYEKDELVKMWMAEAIIEPGDEERTEDIGGRYFKDLSDRFFFECTSDAKYKMHDLIHDLAQLISSPFCCQLVNGVGDFKEKARCVSILCNDVDQPALEIIRKSKKLRTVLLPGQNFKAFDKVQREIFHSLRYVRLLDLSSSTPLTQLPDSIGELKLLRYLDLSATEIEKLPDSICKLYNLETLKLLGCHYWNFILPRNFASLVKLRHLELDDMFWFKATFPPSMGCQTSLHNLHKFQVGCKTGYKLEELKNMAYLTGKLHISKLENAVDAGEANLKGKEMLQKVVYEWSNSDLNLQDDDIENQVLEDLEPHPMVLKELEICHYRGTAVPTWMQADRLGQFRKLVSIRLNHCRKIKILSLGKLPELRELLLKNMLELKEWQEEEEEMYRSIKRLRISFCPKLKKVPFLFLNLIDLKIKKCDSLQVIPWGPIKFITLVDNPELEHWNREGLKISIVPYTDENGNTRKYITLTLDMINVKIINCPKLHELPSGLYPQKLEIRGCKSLSNLPDDEHAVRLALLALEACHDDETILNLIVGRVPSSSSLLSLEISNISNLICLPKWPLLPKVETLFIHGCEDLEHLSTPEKRVFEGFTSLKSLSIRNCPMLVTLPVEGLPTSLQYFSIGSCERLESFGPSVDTLNNLTSLTDLYIEDCPAFQSLPEGGLPTSLQHLSIHGCPSLTKRCEKEDGPDWPKIQGISDLEIETPPSSSAARHRPGSPGHN
ncbi:PREDICTED: putative disease resistance protein RGA3 [Prunus mume]|uniref:Disease resistance protein RGA3 n=1 Tax=Prunus mume TaxID=102107 RepID=A0ABM0PSM2_PRUMU|nr:PREDICTED: putative disease resistance protein RGA3 [Prunus mume]